MTDGGTPTDPDTDSASDDEPVVSQAQLPSAEYASGTRLEARFWLGDDGFEKFRHFWDKKLNIACRFRTAEDGVLRCLPFGEDPQDYYRYETSLVYFDGACAEPWAGAWTPNCGGSMQSAYVSGLGVRVVEPALDQAEQEPSGDLYMVDAHAECSGPLAGATVWVRPIKRIVPPEELVGVRQQLRVGDGRLSANYLIADDGAISRFAWHDTELDHSCALWEDPQLSGWTCFPFDVGPVPTEFAPNLSPELSVDWKRQGRFSRLGAAQAGERPDFVGKPPGQPHELLRDEVLGIECAVVPDPQGQRRCLPDLLVMRPPGCTELAVESHQGELGPFAAEVSFSECAGEQRTPFALESLAQDPQRRADLAAQGCTAVLGIPSEPEFDTYLLTETDLSAFGKLEEVAR